MVAAPAPHRFAATPRRTHRCTMSSSTPPPPPEVTTEPTASDQEIARLRERVKELEARLAPPEPRTATNDEPQFSSIVLFGADGNLATKKTFPTLFALWRKKLLPRDIVIVGYAREAMDTETFRKNVVYKATTRRLTPRGAEIPAAGALLLGAI